MPSVSYSFWIDLCCNIFRGAVALLSSNRVLVLPLMLSTNRLVTRTDVKATFCCRGVLTDYGCSGFSNSVLE